MRRREEEEEEEEGEAVPWAGRRRLRQRRRSAFDCFAPIVPCVLRGKAQLKGNPARPSPARGSRWKRCRVPRVGGSGWGCGCSRGDRGVRSGLSHHTQTDRHRHDTTQHTNTQRQNKHNTNTNTARGGCCGITCPGSRGSPCPWKCPGMSECGSWGHGLGLGCRVRVGLGDSQGLSQPR